MTAERPAPPAAAAPTCQEMTFCARCSPRRTGVSEIGGENTGQRAAEHDEPDHGHRDIRLPPDRGRAEHGDAAAPADHGLRRDRAGQHGKADPDGGQRAPVAERGQARRARRQVQLTAAETRLPLPGADFEAGVDEEDAHARDHYPRRTGAGTTARPDAARSPRQAPPRRPRLGRGQPALALALAQPQHGQGQVEADLDRGKRAATTR